jgi:predicted nucleotidyltransferase
MEYLFYFHLHTILYRVSLIYITNEDLFILGQCRQYPGLHPNQFFDQYGVTGIRVFGSAARGDDSTQSDIDFLVEMEPDRSLFDMGGLLMDLETLLDCKVDVVTEKSLHWYIRERVLSEARAL